MLSVHAASLAILDIHVGGDKPILVHTSQKSGPLHVELLDSQGTSHMIQFSRNRDFNRFYELLVSLDHSASEDTPTEHMPLRSFSVEPSSADATMFLSTATWNHVQVKIDKAKSQQPNRTRDVGSSPTVNICVFSTEAVMADRFGQGMYASVMRLVHCHAKF